MPTSDQLRAQIKIVINFAVQNNLNLAILAGDGLVAAANINNAEPSDRQPNTIANKKTTFIGAAMPNGIRHALEGAPYFRT